LYSKHLNIYIVDMIHSKMMETTKKRGSTSFEKKEELVRIAKLWKLSRCSSESSRAGRAGCNKESTNTSSSSSSSSGNKQLITE